MALVSRLIGFDSRTPKQSTPIECVQEPENLAPPQSPRAEAPERMYVPTLEFERTPHYRGVIPPALYRDNRTARGFQPKYGRSNNK